MSERVPCPVEHLNFSRSIRIGDETHVQTCLRLGVDDKEVPNGQPVWTTVGIVYDRPACPLCGAPDREQQAEAEARTRTTTRATWRSGRKREQDLN